MDDFIKYFLIPVSIIIILSACWFYSIDKRGKEQAMKEEKFIGDCANRGGRVEQIGEWYTNTYLVCNPKEQ